MMRAARVFSVATLFSALFVAAPLLGQSLPSGPNDRQPTDPKSVTAPAAPGAVKPVALEDLYTTRLVDAAVISPNGAEVALTTNLAGRTNLWKMSLNGSW